MTIHLDYYSLRVMKLFFFASFFIIYFFTVNPILAQFAGGAGTEEDPFQIATLEQLQDISNHADKHYIQISDIDASDTEDWDAGKGFKPIGDDAAKFTGSYDGDEFRISDLTIDRIDEDYVGLFGFADGAALKNISLLEVRITGNDQTGAIAGEMTGGMLVNCSSGGKVAGNAFVGGLLGRSSAYVETSHASGDVLAGSGEDKITAKTVENWLSANNFGDNKASYYKGDVSVFSLFGNTIAGSLAGGLIGGSDGDVTASFFEGNVTGRSLYIGGLIGGNSGDIKESYAIGEVTGGSYTGGLLGSNSGDIRESHAVSEVTGWNNIGGLIGMNIGYHGGGNIIASYSEGNVRGSEYEIGGLIGTNEEGTIMESHSKSDVIASEADLTEPVYASAYDAGGLIGLNLGEINNSHSEGDVIVRGSYAGGLVGRNSANITQSYANGDVTGDEYVGGLIGYNNGEINESYSDGNVMGENNLVGGLIGENRSNVTQSYSTGNVRGIREVGGLIGVNNGDAEVVESYSSGEVTGADDTGGFIGINDAAIQSSYWDAEYSDQSQGIGSGPANGVTGLSTQQMTSSSAFDSMPDFDFEDTWELTEGYPALHWQNADAIPIPTHASYDDELPQEAILNQNYPNPFNPTTNIEFGLPEAGNVQLEIYDLLGQKVAILIDHQQNAGWHQITFDGTGLSSGVYIYRLQTSNLVKSKILTLIK